MEPFCISFITTVTFLISLYPPDFLIFLSSATVFHCVHMVSALQSCCWNGNCLFLQDRHSLYMQALSVTEQEMQATSSSRWSVLMTSSFGHPIAIAGYRVAICFSSVSYYHYFLNNFCRSSYPNFHCTDFHAVFTIHRYDCRWMIWPQFFIPQGTLP